MGWYHSGPKLRPSDLTINELFRRYCSTPVLTIIDPVSEEGMLPVKAYVALEEISDDGSTASRTFAHVNCAIEAEEAEEVGVEHLLRDIKDTTVGTLAQAIATKVKSLGSLDRQLAELDAYLEKVLQGSLPVNQRVIAAVQDMFNLLPDLHSPAAQLALTVKTNDQLAAIYVGSLARAVVALHQLIANRIDAAQVATITPKAVSKHTPAAVSE